MVIQWKNRQLRWIQNNSKLVGISDGHVPDSEQTAKHPLGITDEYASRETNLNIYSSNFKSTGVGGGDGPLGGGKSSGNILGSTLRIEKNIKYPVGAGIGTSSSKDAIWNQNQF